MDGVNNVTGVRTLVLPFVAPDGTEQPYTACISSIADLAEREDFVLSRRPPVRDLVQSLDAVEFGSAAGKWLRDLVETRATRPRFLALDELQEFLATPQGVAYSVWRMFRDHHAEFGKRTGENAPVAHTVGSGPYARQYAIGPDLGIERAVAFLERNEDRSDAITRAIRETDGGVTDPT